MKLTLTVVAILAVLVLAKAEEEKSKDVPPFVKSFQNLHRGPPKVEVTKRTMNVKTKYITQKLDHFDSSNQITWQMRYMVNEKYFEDGGPMFIYLGGEWEISPGSIVSGIFPDLANEHKGILFYTEHRYYSQSRPASSLSVNNLQYLNVKQSLADLAHFIRTQHETDPRLKNSKVIISGCSYSASMVVWFSKLYPELVHGGWASSAPILAKVDFKEYAEVVGKALYELGSQQCYNRVKNGIAELEAMFAGNRSDEAKALLKLCNNFDHHNDLDLWSLFSSIFNTFSGIVQYQSEGDVPNQCSYLMSFSDDLTAITSVFINNFLDSNNCTDATYQSNLDYYLNSSYINDASRRWLFQTCNEFGWFQSLTSPDQPFGTKLPVTFYTTLCADVFGSKYTNKHIHDLVDETNQYFGGMDPQVQNVYMTYGASDPWNVVGHGVAQGASVIPRASHCADFRSISNNDSPEMRASKLRLVELVRQWLA